MELLTTILHQTMIMNYGLLVFYMLTKAVLMGCKKIMKAVLLGRYMIMKSVLLGCYMII